jgi:hypothetical protein
MPTLLTSRYLEFMMRGGKRSECGYKPTGTHILMAVEQKWKGDEKYSGWMASEKKGGPEWNPTSRRHTPIRVVWLQSS